jgi:hypothetical protein
MGDEGSVEAMRRKGLGVIVINDVVKPMACNTAFVFKGLFRRYAVEKSCILTTFLELHKGERTAVLG